MKTVRISAEQWPGVLASRADTFRDRFFGIKGGDAEGAVLISTRSVHTFGLDRPLQVVGLDKSMRVIGSRRIPPNRIVYFGGARFVLELDENAVVPRPGTQLEVSDG